MDEPIEQEDPKKADVTSIRPFDLLGELDRYSSLMTVDEVATLLRISKFTVYRMVRLRQIPSFVVGGSRRFDPKSISYWLRKKDPTLANASRYSSNRRA
jgi:excisionase family DNA binding protein